MLKASDLPLRYCGYSHCFRREAGTNGTKDKGLYRVHQFTKVCIRIIMSIFRLKCIMFVCRLKVKRCSMSLLLFKKRFAMIWNCMFVFLKCLLVFVHYNAFFFYYEYRGIRKQCLSKDWLWSLHAWSTRLWRDLQY